MTGIILIVAAFFIGKLTGAINGIKNRKKTVCTVVSLLYKDNVGQYNRNYTAVVEYTVDGRTYTSHSRASSSRYYTGQKVKIVYDEKDPSKVAVLPPFYITALVFVMVLIGTVIAVGGFSV